MRFKKRTVNEQFIMEKKEREKKEHKKKKKKVQDNGKRTEMKRKET